MTDMASGESYPCLKCGHLLGSEACGYICCGQPQRASAVGDGLSLTTPSMVDVTVSVSAPLKHQCPFVDEADNGTVEISWRCNGATFELHALRTWLDQWAPCDLSHEQITEVISTQLGCCAGIKDVHVVTRWTTAGMSVTVTGGTA